MPVALNPPANDKPQTSDEFNADTLSPMWEWNHNPVDTRWSLTERKGFLRLHTAFSPDLLHARNTITESLQDEAAEITVRLDLERLCAGDHTGLSVFEKSLSYLGVRQEEKVRKLVFSSNGDQTLGPEIRTRYIQLRGRVDGDLAQYSYSVDDGHTFAPFGSQVKLVFGWWKGARPAIFAFNTDENSKRDGLVDIDWVHYSPIAPEQIK